MFKSVNELYPSNISEGFSHVNEKNPYNLRECNSKLCLPHPKTEFLKRSFNYRGAKLWNSLPKKLREAKSINDFKHKLKNIDLSVIIP